MHYLTTVAQRFEVDLISSVLADAGVHTVVKASLPERARLVSRSVEIYVDDLQRAREALQSGEGFDEDELARLSEESYREATGQE